MGKGRGGEDDAVVGRLKPGGSHAMIEDANSQRVMQGPVRAAAGITVAGDDDQIESSLISEFGAQNPGMGSSSQQDEMEEGSANHLFTDAMKLQLRAQILVLGDLLKGIAPNPDWLEDACLESAIGAESVLLEPADVPRGAQDVNTCIDDIPAELNLQRISSDFRDVEARMSPLVDLQATRDAIKGDFHSAGRRSSTPGEPSSSGKEGGFRDDRLAQETDMALSGQLLITYDHIVPTARSNSNVAGDSLATENRIRENDKHLDMAQASAQDALTTATSALAQSHMVWARLHSQDHSEEGIARDARLASVAATVAAASSVAKAAVEAARAIAEVSMDAFIQASGYQLGDTGARTPQFGSARSRPPQVDGWERSPYSNARENAPPSQQRAEMLESVVQAAGKAAEAATQAGAVLARANPMVQTGGLSGFWSRKPDEADVEHEGDQANEMIAVDEVDALNEMDELDGTNKEDAVEEMEDIQEEETTHQYKSDAVNDVHEQDIVHQDEAVEDDMAAANGDEVAAANGDKEVAANEAGVTAVNEDEVVGANEAGVAAVNEDGVVGANELAEPVEQEKRISPRSRKAKRGSGRYSFSRAKRPKVSASPLPAQSSENAMHKKVDVSESLNDVRDENARGKKPGAKHMETTPVRNSGEDTPAIAPAQGAGDVMHKSVEVLESPRNVQDRNLRSQKRGAKHIEKRPVSITAEDVPANAPVQDEMHKQDGVSTSRKITRGKKRGTMHIETRPVSITGEDVPATAPAQSPENEVQKQDDASTSQKNAPGKKRGAKHIENRPVSTTGEDVPATAPAQSPENEVHIENDVLKGRKNGQVKKRGSKHSEDTHVRRELPATEAAQSPENEVHIEEDVLKSRKNVRGKKHGAKHSEDTHARRELPATEAAQSPENEVHIEEDVLKSRKNVRGKKHGAKHSEDTHVRRELPATEAAQSPENEVHIEEDVLKSRKNVRGKKHGAKHSEDTHVRRELPATEAAQSPENEVHIEEDILKSRKNVRGKKRGAKHIENAPVSTSGGDLPPTALVQSPENELRKKDDVPKNRKHVQVEDARGRTRSAKHIENMTVITPGKDSADGDLRDPETNANTHEGPESPIQDGSAVEAMIDEVGLRGGWFSGTVLKIVSNEVFVELHDLLTDDGKDNIKEWFPLVEGFNPYHPRRHARPVHPFTIFSEAGSRKRRRVALGSQTWHVGDLVDAFIQDGWWEGIVAELNDLDSTKATVYFPEENDTQVVKTWDLRPSFLWKDNKWIPWKSSTLAEDERPQKRYKNGAPNKEVRPDELTSNGEGIAEGSRIQEDVGTMPEAHKSRVKDQQESKTPFPRSNWKKSNKEIVSSEQKRHSANKVHQTDGLSPGTSKKLDDTTAATRTDAAQGKTPITKGSPRYRRKRYT